MQASFKHGAKKNETAPEDGKLTIDTLKVGVLQLICLLGGRGMGTHGRAVVSAHLTHVTPHNLTTPSTHCR